MSIELILEILVEIQIENQDVSSLNFLFKTPTLLEFLFWKKFQFTKVGLYKYIESSHNIVGGDLDESKRIKLY